MAIQPNKLQHDVGDQRVIDEILEQCKNFGEEIKRLKEIQNGFQEILLQKDLVRDERVIREQRKYQKQLQEIFEQQQRYTEELLRLKKEKDRLQKGLEKEDKKNLKIANMPGIGKSVTAFSKPKSSRMKTHEQYVEEVRALVGDEYTVIGTYSGATEKIKIKHNVCGLEYEVMPNGFTSKGNRCPECTKVLKGRQTKRHDTFVVEVYAKVASEYTVLGEYKGSRKKLSMRHNVCGHVWEVAPHLFIAGTRCPKCAEEKMKEERGKTHEQYVQEVNKIHKGEYTILGEYVNGHAPIEVLHNICGYKWKVRAQNLLGNSRCPKCYGIPRKTQEQFEEEVRELVGEEYQVVGEYVNSRTKIEILHKKCGHIYEVLPSAFLQGRRCPKCRTDVTVN